MLGDKNSSTNARSFTQIYEMGSGLAAAHGGSSVAVPKTTLPATPLTSIESVAPHTPKTATSVTTVAAAAPLPPTSAPTANPRRHLSDPNTNITPPTVQLQHNHYQQQHHDQRNQATLHASATPVGQRLQVLNGEYGDAQQTSSHEHPKHVTVVTPLPAEDCRPPPSMLDTAVRRQLESGEGDAAVTNPNADLSSVGDEIVGNEEDEKPLRVPCNDESLDLNSAGSGRDYAQMSPSPDVPEHPDNMEVPPLLQQQRQQQIGEAQQTSLPTIVAPDSDTATAGGLTAGQVNDAMIYRPITRSASPGQALGQYDGLPLTSVQQVLEAKHKVYRICLTGGPCAGKSTMLSAMQAKIPQRTGFRVMCVPEAATLLVTGGMQWDSNIVVAQQSALLRTQLALEDQFYAAAVASGEPTVIVSDRGTMDGRAFCSDAQFQEILRNIGSTVDALRNRYDAVLHMVTAANGAEEFYNLDNPARYEDLDGARASDLRLQEMYVGHHMFRLLDNSTTFEEKIERGLQIVGQVVHREQCAPSMPSYYLVRRCPQQLPVASASYTTFTTVLNNSQMNDIRLLVKREMPDGSCMHFFKSVKDMAGASASSASVRSASRAMSNASNHTNTGGCGASSRSNTTITNNAHPFSALSQQRIESAQRISSREYNKLKQHRDRARTEVVMHATHFIFEGANYELATLLAPSWAAGRQTLTVESCSPAMAAVQRTNATALRLPPFLEVDREVPVESLTTAFLISHRETGALYTSLAFAPVFSRAVVTALGAHADTENILNSTLSTPRGPPLPRGDTGTLLASPVGTETKKGDDVTEKEMAAPEVVAPLSVSAAHAVVPVRRGLGSLNVNTVPTTSSTMSKATPKESMCVRLQQEVTPYFLGSSVSVQHPRNVVTPSRFSLSGEEDREVEVMAGAKPETALAGGHPQPERRVFARDPETILPPIESKRLHAH